MPESPVLGRDPLVIDAGELHNFITIQRASSAGDSFGKSINPVQWDDVYSGWAAIYSAGGREVAMASHIVSAVTHVVKIRWSPVVKMRANYRVVFRTRYFTVSYVENVKERDSVLLLYCVEVDSGGM
jgi:SPP1 family predicted phage head-tail adaptor